jgi:hypothetical protein
LELDGTVMVVLFSFCSEDLVSPVDPEPAADDDCAGRLALQNVQVRPDLLEKRQVPHVHAPEDEAAAEPHT